MRGLNFQAFESAFKSFDFQRLFVDVLGWNHPPGGREWRDEVAGNVAIRIRSMAEVGGVYAIQVVAVDALSDESVRLKIWRHVSQLHAENVILFTDRETGGAQSLWYWVKRDRHPETGKPRLVSRRHDYFRNQPVDLFAGKLQAMVVELSELDGSGRLSVLEAARRIEKALDVEATTKKFFAAYQQEHLNLIAHIHGIDDERDRRWYASVLLNRLMFVWFMQKTLP